INVRSLNPRIDWARSPFKVVTQRTDWPRPAGHPRRAAVSSFGFGGTNFHVVLQEHVPGALGVRSAVSLRDPRSPARTALPVDVPAFQAHMKTAAALEAEPLVLDAAQAALAAARLAAQKPTFPETGQGVRLRDLLHPHTA